MPWKNRDYILPVGCAPQLVITFVKKMFRIVSWRDATGSCNVNTSSSRRRQLGRLCMTRGRGLEVMVLIVRVTTALQCDASLQFVAFQRF